MNSEYELQKILEKVLSVPGVAGVACADGGGDIKAMMVPEVYDQNVMTAVVGEITDLQLNIRELGVQCTEFHYHYKHTEIMVRTSKSTVLVILTATNVNATMLGIAVKMALKKADGVIGALDSGAVSVAAQSASPWGPAVSYQKSYVAASQNTMSNVAVKQHVVPLPRQDILRLRTELSRHLGPSASLAMKKVLADMDQSFEQFDSTRVAELIMNLGDTIQSDHSRSLFNQAASVILSEWIVSSTDIPETIPPEREPEPTEQKPQQSPEMMVFNTLLNHIIANLGKVDSETCQRCFSHLESSLATLNVGGAATGELQNWCRHAGDTELTLAFSVAEMAAVTHTIYVFLCEYVGPVAGDQILGRAIKAAERLDEASTFSPRQLL